MTGAERPEIDVAIITIREDEAKAVLTRLKKKKTYQPGQGRLYTIAEVPVRDPERPRRTVAVVRCPAEGPSIAQDVARDVIEDLAPRSIFVVGIGGGFPSTEYSLGDVLVATRVQDVRIMAVLEGRPPESDVRGGAVEPEVENVVAALQQIVLGDWSSPGAIRIARPQVQLDGKKFYGPPAWKKKAKAALVARFGNDGNRTDEPHFATGAFVSSDWLVKDTATVTEWLKYARKSIGCEMEMAGVFQAARRIPRVYPVYGIRGVSDIVGFRRDERWTAYACHSAASFTLALIRSGVIPAKERASSERAKPRRTATAPAKTTLFQSGQDYIDRGEADAAAETMLAGTPFPSATIPIQLSVAAVWQKFGFIAKARGYLKTLKAPKRFSRATPEERARCGVIELKIRSQTADFDGVIAASIPLLDSLQRLTLHAERSAVYRRTAIAHAALGKIDAARRAVEDAAAAQKLVKNDHSRATGGVFSAITLALGTRDMKPGKAITTLRDASGRYVSGPLDRSSFQGHPVKSAVMCLFSEAAVRMLLQGEGPEAWICLTASYAIARVASADPAAEGFAELLSLLLPWPKYHQLFQTAMDLRPRPRESLVHHPQISRYLGKCQELPRLAERRDGNAWAEMLVKLDEIIATESGG